MGNEPIGPTTSRRRVLSAGGLAIGAWTTGTVAAADATEECDVEYDYALVVGDRIEGPVASESYCEVEKRFADALGVQAGDQVRLGSRGSSRDQLYPEKLFTVSDVRRDHFGVVRAKQSDLAEVGVRRLGVGRVSGTVPHPCYDEYEEADERDEFVERTYNDDADGAAFVVLAPHGGIETNTHLQAERAADEADVPAWICYGNSEDVVEGTYEPFERWHVTSTALSRRSFPALRDVADREYRAALSFHGRSFDGDEQPYVAVGGRATALRTAVASALESTLADLDVEVHECGDDACKYPGQATSNVVNDVTESGDRGVQIEQPLALRLDHHEAVARDAASAMQRALEDV